MQTRHRCPQSFCGTDLKAYGGFPHGMPTTQADTINADLLAFLQASTRRKEHMSTVTTTDGVEIFYKGFP